MVDVFGQGLQDIAENCTKVAIWWAGEVAYLGNAQIYVSFYSGASLGGFGAPFLCSQSIQLTHFTLIRRAAQDVLFLKHI